jgi:two-component system sensor histidine kinase HydH
MGRKILFQVTAPALVVGLLLVGTCLVSAWSIHRLQTNLVSILSENVASLQAALDLENKIRELRYHSLVYFQTPNQAALKRIKDDEADFEKALEGIEKVASLPEEQKYLDNIKQGYKEYKDGVTDLQKKVDEHGPQTNFAQLLTEHPIRHVIDPCQRLWDFNKQKLDEYNRESNRISNQANLALLLLGLLGPIGGLFCGYGIVRGINRSIAQLNVRVRDVVHRLDRPVLNGTKKRPPDSDNLIDVASVTVAAGDLAAVDQQLQHVVHRVEEVMERLQRHHWEMLRAEQLAAVGRLAAGVAHEIRNPLTGMKLLVEAALRPQQRQSLSQEDLEVIHGEITRLEETVHTFLSFARLPALQQKACDLRDVLPRPLELIRTRARQQGVELIVQVPDQPLPVNVDASQLGTVLVNLFLNALDVMPCGGCLRVVLSEEDGDCCLQVCDTGPGIAAEITDRLFTPFASTKPTGTGLGLSLSRRIIEEHGGQITAGNRAEGGACFRITLPRNDREEGQGARDEGREKKIDIPLVPHAAPARSEPRAPRSSPLAP